MKILIILVLISTVYGEAPYQPSGWKPNGQQFSLPSRQPLEQYGPPPQNYQQQYNTLQYSAPQQYNAPQISSQYITPQIYNQYAAPQPSNQYAAPQINNQNTAPQLNNQYGAPLVNQQYGAPQVNNEYGPPSVDPLRTQYTPREEPARNFAGSNINTNQNIPVPGRTYLSQTPNQKSNIQNQSGKLIQSPQPQNEFSASNQQFQNVEQFPQRQNTNKEESVDSFELNPEQDELNDNLDEFAPEKEYGTPTTTKRPTKVPRKPERTTQRPTTTTEEPENDGESDQPNVAISTAVAGASASGQYYIVQPDGKLQRVIYMTSPDPNGDKNAAVIANLMYETVEPLKGPIYQYIGSELVRIN